MGKKMQTGEEEKSFPPEKIMLRLCLCLSFVNLPNQNRTPALNVIFISACPTILSAYSTSSFRKGMEQFVFWIINEISILPGSLRFFAFIFFFFFFLGTSANPFQMTMDDRFDESLLQRYIDVLGWTDQLIMKLENGPKLEYF